jgi:membrane protease YdiL (CAAX protease family)
MWRWLVLAVAMAYPTALSWIYFIGLAQAQQPGALTSAAPNPLVLAAYSLGKIVQFAFPLVWLWGIERRRLALAAPNRKGMALGIAFGLLVGAGTFAFYGFLRHYTGFLSGTADRLHVKIQEFGIGTPSAYIAFAIFLSVAHSFLEEYYWRWFVFGSLRERLPLAAAISLASLAFMAHHVVILGVYFPGRFWSLAMPLSVGVGVGGAIWAWLYERSGSICACWLSHLLVDAAIMAVGYNLAFG